MGFSFPRKDGKQGRLGKETQRMSGAHEQQERRLRQAERKAQEVLLRASAREALAQSRARGHKEEAAHRSEELKWRIAGGGGERERKEGV